MEEEERNDRCSQLVSTEHVWYAFVNFMTRVLAMAARRPERGGTDRQLVTRNQGASC